MKRSDIFFIVLILCIIVMSIMHWGFLGIILLAIVFGLWDARSEREGNQTKKGE
jgi:hypothetical protein